jgi:hypothetical protein
MGAGRWGKQENARRERDARADGEATKGRSGRGDATTSGGAEQAAADGRANARWDGSTVRLAAYGVS